MSDSISEAIPHAESVQPVRSSPQSWTRWPRRLLFLLVFLWLADRAISLAIQHTRLRRVVTARIEAAFGRPVEVGDYNFSLWNGPALEADSVTVGEDPRFGQEYFLRAESMTVRLRWARLLRGHVELGTLSLTRPSLNLVRNASGDWNLVEWLPQPSGNPPARVPVGPLLPSALFRFSRIEVDGGRVNFKNGDEKLPLAFVGVKGTVDTDRLGHWRMNLDATPWRAAVVVQQAGTIHVSGDLGGTSSRLRPAALDVTWTDASISDVLRLAGGDDDGIRGALALAIRARTHDRDNGWDIQGRAELRQVHRWDLALRADTPSVNLIVRTNLNPATSDIDLADVTIEIPHSIAHGSGTIRWNRAQTPAAEKYPPVQFTFFSNLDVGDLLPWLRAFHPGVADSVSVGGRAEVRADVRADPRNDNRAGLPAQVFLWPLHLVNATVSSQGLEFSAANLRKPAHLGPVQFRYDRGLVSLSPVSLAFRSPDDAIRFESSAKPGRSVSNLMRISGNVSDVRDVLAAAAAMGWNIAAGWDVSGPVRADLRWQGEKYPWQASPVGYINWGAGPGVAVLRVPFLNLPIGDINAIAEWKPGSRDIALTSAQAFGARWSGTFDRRVPDGDWQFALSADHLTAAELDRWLNPAWRESFLGRMLPFLNPRSSVSAGPESLRASGRLALDQFTLAPLVVRNLKGNLKVAGRRVELTDATGQFYGGQVGGSLTADLEAAPGYHADLNFTHLDMPSLIAATPALAGLHAESASGEISFDARGATRADLIASLACQGNVRAVGPELLNLDLRKALSRAAQVGVSARFLSGAATFSCGQRRIEFQSLTLAISPGASANGVGSIDFNRNLDLRFQVPAESPESQNTPGAAFRITGTLAAPRVVLPQPSTRRSR